LVVGEQEQVAGCEQPATLPAGHWSSETVAGKGTRREHTVHKNAVAESAHLVSGHGQDEFDEIC
jgi:hypothetical protein